MRVVHWSRPASSGLHRVAESLVSGERTLGLTSHLCNPDEPSGWDEAARADVHVVHASFPDGLRPKLKKSAKLVFVAHGTPEHCYEQAFTASRGGYGHADHWMTLQYWLKAADARVTFWPRHAAIYRTMLPREATVDVVPMGVDTAFWTRGASLGKWAGAPSVATIENAHRIKWPLDLFLLWPWVLEQVPEAYLHAPNTPLDHHRLVFPLVNANGTAHRAHVSQLRFDDAGVRNLYRSVDFVCGLVRYGDHNRTQLEAIACGAKSISYAGNPYAHFWVSEGDQRTMAEQLVKILTGKVKPRTPEPVPSLDAMCTRLVGIYERVSARRAA